MTSSASCKLIGLGGGRLSASPAAWNVIRQRGPRAGGHLNGQNDNPTPASPADHHSHPRMRPSRASQAGLPDKPMRIPAAAPPR